MLRLAAALFLLGASGAQAQVWFPVEPDGTFAPGGFSGMPESPQRGDPVETVPRNRYDPAYPSRGLEGDGKGVPVLELSPRNQGRLIDREPLSLAQNPTPQIPIGEEHLWASGVPNVVDGDSLGLNGELFRLAGIDAPEVDQLCYRGNITHRCGVDARTWLANTIEDVRLDCRIHYRDAANRVVATCWSQGREINAWAIEQGQALVWAGAPSPYTGIEEQARAAGAGVWAFDFRHPAEWRAIMDAERSKEDAAIANGTGSAVPPFPYRPFTENHTQGRGVPVYDLGN